MANTVTTTTLRDTERGVTLLTNVSLDTSNLSDSVIADVSAMVPVPVTLCLKEVHYWLPSGITARLEWDATTDAALLNLVGDGYACFDDFGGIKDSRASGYTGDVLLTTLGYSSGTVAFTLLTEWIKQGA